MAERESLPNEYDLDGRRLDLVERQFSLTERRVYLVAYIALVVTAIVCAVAGHPWAAVATGPAAVAAQLRLYASNRP